MSEVGWWIWKRRFGVRGRESERVWKEGQVEDSREGKVWGFGNLPAVVRA